MATLTIRDLDDEIRDKLRIRAADHGRSMEAEVSVAELDYGAARLAARNTHDVEALGLTLIDPWTA